eukprot:g12363.t1
MLRVGCLLFAAADLVTFVAGEGSPLRRWHVLVRGAVGVDRVDPAALRQIPAPDIVHGDRLIANGRGHHFILDPAAVNKFLQRSSDEELYQLPFDPKNSDVLSGMKVRFSRQIERVTNWEGRFGARDNLEATAARVEVAELLLTFGAAPNGTKIFKTIPDHLTDPVGHEEAETELNQRLSPLYYAWRLDTNENDANENDRPLFHDYGDDQRSLEAQARLPALLLLFGADFFDLFRGERFWSNAPDKHPLRFVRDAKFGEGHGKMALRVWLKGVERSAVPGVTSGNDRTMERLRFVINFLEKEINQPATLLPKAFLAAGKLSQDTPQLSSPEAATGIRKGYDALAAYKNHETSGGRFPLVVRAYKRRLARRLREKEERDLEALQNSGAAAVVQPPSLSTSIPDRSREFEVLLQRIAEVQQEEAQDQQLVANAETLKRVAQLAQELNRFHDDGFASLEGLSENEELLVATVLLHYKGKGDPASFDNHRGLVCKSILHKVLSRALATRWSRVLELVGHYTPSQQGFRNEFEATEPLYLVRKAVDDIARVFGISSTPAKLAVFVQADVQKAYPSFPIQVFVALMEAFGLAGTRYAQAAVRLHVATRYRVKTAMGVSQPYTLKSGFGEGDVRSPGDFASSYEVVIRVLHALLRDAGVKQAGLSLAVPRYGSWAGKGAKTNTVATPERYTDVVQRLHPKSADQTVVRLKEVLYADDSNKMGTAAPDLVTYAGWDVSGGKIGTRDNKKKTDVVNLSDTAATSTVRFLGNWLDNAEDLRVRQSRMAFAVAETRGFAGAAETLTELRVSLLSRVRSKGTFAAETRTWTAAELGGLQKYENDALIQLAGYKRWQLRAYHICMQSLRMDNFVEPVTPFVRFGQARLMGHIARAGHSHVAHSAFCGHFFPNFDDVGVLELRWLTWPKQGSDSPTVWSQVLASVREVYGRGNELPEDVVLALARCRDLWRTVIHEIRVYFIIRDIRAATGESAARFTPKVISEYEQKWVEHFTKEDGWTPCTPLPGCSSPGRGTLNSLKPELFDCCPRDRFAGQPFAYSCTPGSKIEDHEATCEELAGYRSPWEVATLPPNSSIGDATTAVRERVHQYREDPGVLGKLYRFVGQEAIDAAIGRGAETAYEDGRDFQSALDEEHHKLVCEVVEWKNAEGVPNFDVSPPGFSTDFYKPGSGGLDGQGQPLARLTGLKCKCAACTSGGGSGRTQRNLREAFVHMRHEKQRRVQAAFREAFPPPPPKQKACPAGQKELKKAERAVTARHLKNLLIAKGIREAKKTGVSYCRKDHTCRVTVRFPVPEDKAVVITRTFDPFDFLTPEGALERAEELRSHLLKEKEEHVARVVAARRKNKKRGPKSAGPEC